jgi:hypothetical protein
MFIKSAKRNKKVFLTQSPSKNKHHNLQAISAKSMRRLSGWRKVTSIRVLNQQVQAKTLYRAYVIMSCSLYNLHYVNQYVGILPIGKIYRNTNVIITFSYKHFFIRHIWCIKVIIISSDFHVFFLGNWFCAELAYAGIMHQHTKYDNTSDIWKLTDRNIEMVMCMLIRLRQQIIARRRREWENIKV